MLLDDGKLTVGKVRPNADMNLRWELAAFREKPIKHAENIRFQEKNKVGTAIALSMLWRKMTDLILIL